MVRPDSRTPLDSEMQTLRDAGCLLRKCERWCDGVARGGWQAFLPAGKVFRDSSSFTVSFGSSRSREDALLMCVRWLRQAQAAGVLEERRSLYKESVRPLTPGRVLHANESRCKSRSRSRHWCN